MTITANPNPQPVSFSRWEAPRLRVTMTENGSIVNWTFQLNIRNEDNSIIFTVTPATSVDDPGSASTPGVFSFILDSATTGNDLPAGDYKYDVWRIDPGNEKRLTWGTLTVLEEQWK